MPIDTTPSQVATNALQAIPFGSLIGGPLNACVEAQSQAAQTTWKFIQQVGLEGGDANGGGGKARNVSFQFQQGGRMANLTVPLLAIVPIPYIAINTIDINFKANISASSSSVQENTDSTEIGASIDGTASAGWGPFSVKANFKASYSSKKDSKATQESKYSVEYTMDIAVKAGQESMPAGLAKVLELLNNSMSVADPNGAVTLNTSQLKLKGGPDQAKLIVSVKDGQGLLKAGTSASISVNFSGTAPTGITVTDKTAGATNTTSQSAPGTINAVTAADGSIELLFDIATPATGPASGTVTVTVGSVTRTATLSVEP